MVKSVTPMELREMLKNGKVTFQYKKNDGSIRTAVGTVKDDLITMKTSGGENKVKSSGYSVYFDLDKNAFRCYAESKIVGVVEA